MRIHKNFNLKSHNTFGIEAHCAAFAAIDSAEDVRVVLSASKLPVQLLGGGSNMLLTQDFFDCLFIKNNIGGIEIINEFSEYVIVAVGGGVNWHAFVLWAIAQDLGGVENLSLIPGTVGAAPIQNIGAYGVELKDVFEKLEAVNVQTFDNQVFTKENCQFGYRESVFKHALKDQFLITKVFFKLTKSLHYLQTSYGDITKILNELNIEKPTIQDVSNAVIRIRQSKLPDPSVIGNAGSFFKNPTIAQAHFDALKTQYPNLSGYPSDTEGVKIAAGWLIEQCGWKGKRFGNVGVHERQALVLVNYGGGKGLEIKDLARKIQQSVLEKFGVKLMTEVNFI
jgi:UDP-N-acetylmuramate dehydrogenase